MTPLWFRQAARLMTPPSSLGTTFARQPWPISMASAVVRHFDAGVPRPSTASSGFENFTILAMWVHRSCVRLASILASPPGRSLAARGAASCIFCPGPRHACGLSWLHLGRPRPLARCCLVFRLHPLVSSPHFPCTPCWSVNSQGSISRAPPNAILPRTCTATPAAGAQGAPQLHASLPN